VALNNFKMRVMHQSNKGVRLILVLILSIIWGTTKMAFSQEIRYDDLYERLSTLNPNQAYTQLLAFQQQNPFFSNTYIQLGNVCEQKLKEIDPLRDFEQANYWSNNAVLFYNLFTVYLKDGDVRRNREYYANLLTPQSGKKIEQEDAVAFLQKRLSYCKSYKDTVALIYSALEKSKGYYNTCVQIFNDINVDYRNLNEALLKADTDFLKLLDSLNIQYSNSIDTFKVYQSLISKFPVGNYKQQYAVKPIETFRLDGITNSDFLVNNFFVWDYGKWVAKFKDTYGKDIVPLRKEIASIQDLFLSNRRKLGLVDTLSPNERFKSFDEFFLFRLGKYDNNSIVRNLFEYHNTYQDLLISSKSSLNNPADSSSVMMNRKLRYYHRLSVEHKNVVSSLGNLVANIDSEKVLNHKDFFIKYYNGFDGLKGFVKSENDLVVALMSDNFLRLKSYLNKEQLQKSSFGYAVGRQRVPLQPNFAFVGDKTNEPFVVYNVSYLKGNPQYVSGYLNKPTKKPIAFVAKVDSSKAVEWVREVGLPNMENGDCAKLVDGFDNGSVALVNAKTTAGNINTYVRVDSKSGVTFKKTIEETSSPCFLQFDEITQNAILGFGEPTEWADNIFNSISLTQVDSAGNAIWKAVIPATGNLVDVVNSEGKVLAFVNYQSYTDDKLGVVANSSGVFAHLIAVINSSDGRVEKLIPVKSVNSYSISKVFSISSNEINLIGQSASSEKLVYLIVNNKGDVIYSNF